MGKYKGPGRNVSDVMYGPGGGVAKCKVLESAAWAVGAKLPILGCAA